MTRGTAAERHRAFTLRDETTGCWLWIGSDVNNQGYARFHVDGRRKLVHRWAFEHFVRPLLPGEVIDHLCNQPLCSNPAHLKACKEQRDNVLRSETALTAVNARKTHCIRGHPFDEANTAWSVWDGRKRRKCRACHREREAAKRSRII